MQLRVGKCAEKDLGLPASSFWAAIHLGSWVSSSFIHSHIMLPTEPYFGLRAQRRGASGQGSKLIEESDCGMRADYLAKLRRDHEKYHRMDLPKVCESAASVLPLPQVDGALNACFSLFKFNPGSDGAAAIDVGSKKPFVEMAIGELEVVMRDLKAHVQGALDVGGCFYYFPAPGCPTGATASVVCLPKIFVGLIPPEKRSAWALRWSQGDPVQHACQDDLQPLSPVVE